MTQQALDILRRVSESAEVQKLSDALRADAELYLVGGTVRDAFAGGQVHDLDCASLLFPDEIRARLEGAGIHCVPTGLKHQTVTAVVSEGGANIEITTFRGPGMDPKGGVSASSSIEEDLRYRDFTINALAYSPASRRVVDPHGGLEDLQRKVVRAPGSPDDRFREDPLRVLRMIRFASRTGFTVDAATFHAAAKFVEELRSVSVERIRDEHSKTLLADQPDRGLRMYFELGILTLLFPEIAAFVGFEQNEFHKDDLFEHTLEVIRRTPPDLALRLAALLHDVGKPASLSFHPDTGARRFFRHESIGAEMSVDFLRRLRYPRSLTEEVVLLVETHMRPIEAGPGGLRRLLRDTGESFDRWRILKEADAASTKLEHSELLRRLAEFDAAMAEVKKGPAVSPLKSLAVNGNDLLALGVTPGPRVGVLLRALHEKVLDDPSLNERETLLALVPELETVSVTLEKG